MNPNSSYGENLRVGLQGITVNGATSKRLLPNGINASIKATASEIWLPRESCRLFEDAFGIVHDPLTDRYLVNETLHGRLESMNASVSFLLGNDLTGDPAVNITLPYSSFDLELGQPIVNSTQRFFPIRRAANDSTATLGLTFLQEA